MQSHSNTEYRYDLPKLLVLAEHCEAVTKQLMTQNEAFTWLSANDAGLAVVAIDKVPVDGEGIVQVSLQSGVPRAFYVHTTPHSNHAC